MHPCSFSNGGTINLILTLTLTLTLRADHRGVRCAKSRCNTSSQNESQSDPYGGDQQLAACITAYTQTYRHTHTQSQTPPKTIPDLHSIARAQMPKQHSPETRCPLGSRYTGRDNMDRRLWKWLVLQHSRSRTLVSMSCTYTHVQRGDKATAVINVKTKNHFAISNGLRITSGN